MKRVFKFIALVVIVLMLLPFTVVNAASKTETVIEKLNEDEYFKSINGKATYEDEAIEIEYSMPNNTYNEVSFSYNGDVIEYSSGEITNYEEAVSGMSYILYSTTLVQTALVLNGYTENQIKSFFESNVSNLDYDINGIEIKFLEETKEYVSEDGSEKINVAPFSIKLDVKKANLNTSSTDPIPSTTTIEDFVKYLKEDESFRTSKDDEGQIIVETDIDKDDDNITISITSYNYNYYWVSIPCENNIMTYEVSEVADFEEASQATSHISFANILLQIALELNGYSDEEIQSFFASADSKLDYDINGIEYKILGEEQEFSDGEGTTVSVTPISIKVDFAKANLNKLTEDYKVLEGANQTYTIGEEGATFKIDADYSLFENGGKVYVDNNEVSSKNYTSKSGSTIITLNKDFMSTLSEGEHTLKVAFNNGESATTKFTVEKASTTTEKAVTTEGTKTKATTKNPKTGDNIIMTISIFAIATLGAYTTLKVNGNH